MGKMHATFMTGTRDRSSPHYRKCRPSRRVLHFRHFRYSLRFGSGGCAKEGVEQNSARRQEDLCSERAVREDGVRDSQRWCRIPAGLPDRDPAPTLMTSPYGVMTTLTHSSCLSRKT